MPPNNVVGDGDPSGIVLLNPGDEGYPTYWQLQALKGAPGDADVKALTPEEVKRLTEDGFLVPDDELEEAAPPPPPKYKMLKLL